MVEVEGKTVGELLANLTSQHADLRKHLYTEEGRLREFAAERDRSITLVSVQPSSPLHGLEGLKHMASAIVPGIYDPTPADRDLGIETEAAYDMVRRLARDEGILVGVSSGAALEACRQVAEDAREGVIVTIFCDSGERYLAERFWGEPTAS